MHADLSSTGGQYHRNPQNTTDLAGGRSNHKVKLEGTRDKRYALLDIGLQCHSRFQTAVTDIGVWLQQTSQGHMKFCVPYLGHIPSALKELCGGLQQQVCTA